VVRGCEVLRHVLPLRIGLEDIAVGADVALLVAVNVTILVPGCLRGRARAWNDAILLFKAASSFWCLAIISARIQRHPLLARQKQWWPWH
jgi:hypothetical protein